MRTNSMIYQAAIAHQAELRRIASERPLRAERSGSRWSWASLHSYATAQRQRARAAADSTRSSVTVERLSF
jgi:hypothetical protein